MADRSQHAAELLEKNLDRLACPVCHAELKLDANAVECAGCTMRYPIVDGLPVLIAPRRESPGKS